MLKRNGSDCNEKLSDVKKKKVKEELCDDEQRSSQLSPENGSSGSTPSSQATSQSPSNQHSSQLSPENCSSGSTPSSQATSQSPSTGGYKMKNGESSQSSPVKNKFELNDDEIDKFAQSSPEVNIDIEGFNYSTVTDKYDTFWNKLFASPNYTTGNNIKLVQQTLSHKVLKNIAVILKRGWQEERYFPKQLAQPLLEACIFNREEAMHLDLKANMFYQYIKPSDLKIIKSKEKVDENSLKVLKSYLNKNDPDLFNIYFSKDFKISVGEEIESACKTVLRKIMYYDVCSIHSKWTPELVGLLEFDKFIFLQQEQSDIAEYDEHDVGTVAPHRLWSTFFYRWNDQIIKFYFKLLQNDIFDKCNICGDEYVGAKHIVSHKEEQQLTQQQKDLHLRMEKERHHNVMNIVVEKLISTKEYSDWNLVVLKQNYREQHWPEELSMLKGVNLYPNIVLYKSNTFPKEALIVEVTICWDHWATNGSIHYDNREKYNKVVTVLKSSGFETKFKDVMIGARGIWSEGLYRLFDEVCEMKRSEITETMEKISKIIIEVAYDFHYKYQGQ